MRGTARAPGSSGNLGPGFDVLAIALDLWCEVSAEPASEWLIVQDGESYEPGAEDFVRSASSVWAAGPFRLEISNEIPRSRGLGSSAAVAAAAAAAVRRAVEEIPTSYELFKAVSRLEGHPDNAAAAVFGGLVVAGDGMVRHLDVHPSLRVVLGIPDAPLATTKARSVLSSEVSRDLAIRSLARLTFLVEGLRTADPAAFAAAAGDELHELPRHDLSPVTTDLMAAARSGGAFHTAWSGAGPTAIAFAAEDSCAAVMESMAEVLDGAGEVRVLDIAHRGWS